MEQFLPQAIHQFNICIRILSFTSSIVNLVLQQRTISSSMCTIFIHFKWTKVAHYRGYSRRPPYLVPTANSLRNGSYASAVGLYGNPCSTHCNITQNASQKLYKRNKKTMTTPQYMTSLANKTV